MCLRNRPDQLLSAAAAGPLHDPTGQLQHLAWQLSRKASIGTKSARVSSNSPVCQPHWLDILDWM